jgi:hypothetical protein
VILTADRIGPTAHYTDLPEMAARKRAALERMGSLGQAPPVGFGARST